MILVTAVFSFASLRAEVPVEVLLRGYRPDHQIIVYEVSPYGSVVGPASNAVPSYHS